MNYETNNFLGLGETLSVQANIGDLSRNLSFGFTEPYLRNKPISVGVQVFAQQVRLQSFEEPVDRQGASRKSLGRAAVAADELQPVDDRTDAYGQRAVAASVARTGVTRVGLAYSLSRSSVTTFNQNTQQRLPVACVPVRRRRDRTS